MLFIFSNYTNPFGITFYPTTLLISLIFFSCKNHYIRSYSHLFVRHSHDQAMLGPCFQRVYILLGRISKNLKKNNCKYEHLHKYIIIFIYPK